MAAHTCLIVDDEPSIRNYVRAILESDGLQSFEAENAVEALKILQKLGGHVDLIVSDIKMPGDMDGIDLAHSVHNSFPALPVILISGYGGETVMQHGETVFEFIPKPFKPETVLNAVRRALAARRGDGTSNRRFSATS